MMDQYELKIFRHGGYFLSQNERNYHKKNETVVWLGLLEQRCLNRGCWSSDILEFIKKLLPVREEILC